MITANDVFKATMHSPIVDGIIKQEIIPRFEKSPIMSIMVDSKLIDDNYKIQREMFIKQMNMRGFWVEIHCDDQPCYKIIIPPQKQ